MSFHIFIGAKLPVLEPTTAATKGWMDIYAKKITSSTILASKELIFFNLFTCLIISEGDCLNYDMTTEDNALYCFRYVVLMTIYSCPNNIFYV